LGDVCVQNATTLKAKIVAMDPDEPKFPGAHGKVRTAVTCAGGGSRAQAICLGLLRAFETTGLMKSIDALVAVSGGSWASAPYMFADKPMDEVVGKATTPGELTLEELSKPPAIAGKAASTNVVTALSKEVASSRIGPHSAWFSTISENFLTPYGLGNLYSTMAATWDDVARIKRDNPALKDSEFFVPQPGRPKVFIVTGTIIKPNGGLANPDGVTGFQMSPDYTGVPFAIDNREVSFQKSEENIGGATSYFIGGGMVETFAYGGAPPEDASISGMADLAAPSRPLSLTNAVAMSSNFYAGNFGGFEAMKGVYWGIGDFDKPQKLQTFLYGDGGLLDNNALYPALQRGVEKFVFFVPTQLPFEMEPDYCGGKEALGTSFNNSWASDDISDKFGYGVCGAGFFRCHNHVFDKKDYIPLLCDMKKAYASKGVLVLRKKLMLRDNHYYMIKGGREVDILFVYNTKAQAFVDALPEDTRESIEAGDHGHFPGFPQFDIFAENGAVSGGALTYEQINLLAAHTEYLVTSQLDLFQDFLKESKEGSAAQAPTPDFV
jgi:hypothetical protein